MAKRGIVGSAQDTVLNAATASVDGVRALAESAAGAAAKAATGAVLQAVKGARRLVRGKPVKRKKTTARKKRQPLQRPVGKMPTRVMAKTRRKAARRRT